MSDCTFDEFKKEITKSKESRKHKITNSIGCYDIYKYIRKNKWFNIGRPLKEHEFYSIIRLVNQELANNLMDSSDIHFPYKMGSLEVRKTEIKPHIHKDGKLHIPYKIDWQSTLKLWYDDQEAMENKILVRCRNNEVFKIIYNKTKADYTNKTYFEFHVNRGVKQELKRRIKQGTIDAFLL